MMPKPASILFILAAAAGLLFAAVSTYDFVQHLDRQLHGIHCSFIPGLGSLDASGSSGCAAALMSPYSSVLRSWIWGGIPVSLAGMAVFAFLLFRGVELVAGQHQGSRSDTLLLVLLSLLPVLTSLVMGAIAIVALGELCKLCVGIYLSSFVLLGAAIWAWRGAGSGAGGRDAWDEATEAESDEEEEEEEIGAGLAPQALVAALELGVFVAVPLALYVTLAPDFSSFVGACGELTKPDDPYGILVPLDGNTAGVPVIEVLDPMCPACRGFERRFAASGLDDRVHRQALLFPLDDECNWMVGSALHPGACAVSAAVLCADDHPTRVLDWAFTEQDAIRAAAATDPGAAGRMVVEQFPELAGCVASNEVRSRLNRSMRWAVSNQLPVMMPQVFVDGVKLCDEDTDLGLDFALTRMLEGAPVTAAASPPPEVSHRRTEVGR